MLIRWIRIRIEIRNTAMKYEHEANLTYPGNQKATGWRICPELAGHSVVMQTQRRALLSSAIPSDGKRAHFSQ
jgi:hypothetical protein